MNKFKFVFPTLDEPRFGTKYSWQLEWRSDMTGDWFPCTPSITLDEASSFYTRQFRGYSLNQYRIINNKTGEVIPCEIFD